MCTLIAKQAPMEKRRNLRKFNQKTLLRFSMEDIWIKINILGENQSIKNIEIRDKFCSMKIFRSNKREKKFSW